MIATSARRSLLRHSTQSSRAGVEPVVRTQGRTSESENRETGLLSRMYVLAQQPPKDIVRAERAHNGSAVCCSVC